MSDDLTPTEYLVMEVLAARWRLNEHIWTFPTTLRPALRRLEGRRLVDWKSGIVQDTVMAHLTDKGLESWGLTERSDFRVVPASHLVIDPADLTDDLVDNLRIAEGVLEKAGATISVSAVMLARLALTQRTPL